MGGRQVAGDPGVRPDGRQQAQDGRALDVRVLHHQQAARPEQLPRGRSTRPGDGQAVGATAVERDLRVVVAHLGVDRLLARRHVRRVAHHHVDAPRPAPSNRSASARRVADVADVGRPQLDPAGGEVGDVLARPGPGRVAHLDGDDAARGAPRSRRPGRSRPSRHTGRRPAAVPSLRPGERGPAAMAAPATSSVSGRGTNTPGADRSTRSRNGARPVRCCSGTRREPARPPGRRTRGARVCRRRGQPGDLAAGDAQRVRRQQLGVDPRLGTPASAASRSPGRGRLADSRRPSWQSAVGLRRGRRSW